MSTCLCMYACLYVYACMHAWMHACMYVCMHACVDVRMYVCMYVSVICMYECVCMHACCIYIFILYMHLHPSYLSVHSIQLGALDATYFCGLASMMFLDGQGRSTSQKSYTTATKPGQAELCMVL